MANNPYSWSTTAANNSSVDGINFAEGQAPNSLNDSCRQAMASEAAFIKDVAGGLSSGGSANAQTITANCGFAAYADGLIVSFKAGATNTGAATLNVNAIGAKSVRKVTLAGEVALTGGEITSGGLYTVMYSTAANSGSGAWLMINPSLPQFAHGTWTPTATITSNITSATPDTGYWTRYGNQVSCWGGITLVIPSAGASTFTMSLPIASNFSTNAQCAGMLTYPGLAGRIISDATNDVAAASIVFTSSASFRFAYQFSYVII